MKLLKKLFVFSIMGAALFGAGYIIGRQEPSRMRAFVEQGKEGVSEKASSVDREVRALRQRIHQYSISRRLSSAQAALAEHNYGILESELVKARKEVESLRDLSPPDAAPSLQRFGARLEDLADSVHSGDTAVKERLLTLEADFEKTYEN